MQIAMCIPPGKGNSRCKSPEVGTNLEVGRIAGGPGWLEQPEHREQAR